MLINCTRCGKTLSSRIMKCPFCRQETGEILNAISSAPVKKKSKFKTSLHSFFPRRIFK
ncbi:hypothetical protein KKG71_02225 [Patescibacteria group bacterium]|nr:hypothetical protein [Patescibacteria group bacterium]